MNAKNKIVVLAALFCISCINTVNASRYQYSLQRFDIEKLAVFATESMRNGCRYGVIVDPEGYIHTVIEGDYVGKHNGKIISITKDGIEIEEVYADGDKKWKVRKKILRIDRGRIDHKIDGVRHD